MRIHTSAIAPDLYVAAIKAGVGFERNREHGSRTHPRAFDIILTGHGRKAGFGADHITATWDEWGIFLAHIFSVDPNARCWAYSNATDFHWQTGSRFRKLTRDQQCPRHKWIVGVPYEQTCGKCGAVRRWERAA